MTRAEAMQQVLDVGGSCGTSVTRHTNYLVVGDIMFGKFRGGYRSGKMKRAEELIAEGRDVEVISEHEFLTLLLS
jgi:NAD-dependent DNA ligase